MVSGSGAHWPEAQGRERMDNYPGIVRLQLDYIYITDVHPYYIKLFPSEIRNKAIHVSHLLQGEENRDNLARFTEGLKNTTCWDFEFAYQSICVIKVRTS